MKNYKLLKISSTKKLRYIVNYTQNHLYVVFLHGFASDIEGKKLKIFNRFSNKNILHQGGHCKF